MTARGVVLPEGREPTVDERFDALESRIEQVSQSVEGLSQEMKRRIAEVEQDAIRRATEARQQGIDAAIEARRLLAAELGANVGRRVLGVVLFIAGLVLNTLGNIWSI